MCFAEGDAIDGFFFLPLRGMKVLPVLASLKLTGSLLLFFRPFAPTRKQSSFNHPFSGALGAVSLREGIFFCGFWKDVNMSSPGQFLAFL